eukprot:EG_transcript_14242
MVPAASRWWLVAGLLAVAACLLASSATPGQAAFVRVAAQRAHPRVTVAPSAWPVVSAAFDAKTAHNTASAITASPHRSAVAMLQVVPTTFTATTAAACLAFFASLLTVFVARTKSQPTLPASFAMAAAAGDHCGESPATSNTQSAGPLLGRRAAGSLWAAALGASALAAPSASALAIPLRDCLYNILRVQEATQQERRLISTGLYKDVQRANVKLAIRMLLDNYRLADCFGNAATYIQDPVKQGQALQVGQVAAENLYTILEYFDASNVDNLKVGEELYGERRQLVTGGLESVSARIDEFVAFFPKAEVQAVRDLIDTENELNRQEYPADTKILNLDPK